MPYVLFSPVGGTDPISNDRDGSMLHIARRYHPDHIMLFLSVRRDIECREERLSAVFRPCEEVDNQLFLLHDTFLLLLQVRNAFPFEDALPVSL